MRWQFLTIISFFLSISVCAYATNTPCSGKKGGISHCDNGNFICNDGSMSASKRICSQQAMNQTGGKNPSLSAASSPTPTAPLASKQPRPSQENTTQSCPCDSANVCTGKRNGTYCTLPSGQKKYQKRLTKHSSVQNP